MHLDLDYCCTVWGRGIACTSKMNTLNNRVARIVLNKPARSNSAELLHELQWLSFSDRRNYQTAVLVYKAKHKLSPEYISNLLTLSSNNTYCLRSTDMINKKIIVPKPRTNYLKTSFSFSSVAIWNSIPSYIRSIPTLVSFKRNYKKYLLNHKLNKITA